MTISPFPTDLPLSQNLVFVWIMHRLAEEFKDHAILKGGMALRLLDCPRLTNDLDYVFCPYRSKNDIEKKIHEILLEMPKATIRSTKNSKALCFFIKLDQIQVQIEAQIALECDSIPLSTLSLAQESNQLPKIIKIMSIDVAMAHKLAAWNERRLLRDLYDIYYFYRILGERPNLKILKHRLSKIESRLPKLKRRRSMTLREFKDELSTEVSALTEENIQNELLPLLSAIALVGLDKKIKGAIHELLESF